MPPRRPREIAAQVLRRWETADQFVEALVRDELGREHLGSRDRALVQELAYGVVRWRLTLDWLIDQKAERRPPAPAIRSLLRLGLYQLFWLDRIPDHAAVFETVELARSLGGEGVAAFVNAVLRGFLREHDRTRQRLEALKTSEPAIGWSHPSWLVGAWTRRWGAATVQRLLAWNNSPAPTYVRINTLQTRAEKLLERWRMEENVEYDFGHWDWVPENTVFKLKSHPPLERLATFRAGAFYVQDPSTLLAVSLLAPQPGERILDACAAPGGKTTYLAQLMSDDGEILAEDSAPDRLELLRANCRRMAIVSVEARPAGSEDVAGGGFDRVLVDAPCSNTGVLRRRLDARFRTRPADLDHLAAQQLALLRKNAPRVRPDGVLVYSTCSLEPVENSGVVGGFLKENPEFRLDGERTLLPFADGVDGAYVARLVRGSGAGA